MRSPRHLGTADPVLGRLIARVGPCRLQLKPAATTFEALAEAIVHQQLSTRAAATIYARLSALAASAESGLVPSDIVAAADDNLRAAGLSRAKTLALRDLAERTRAGKVPDLDELRNMDEAGIVETLTRIRGIGRWSVEMLLIFRLGRPDVLPLDDLGVQRGFEVTFRRTRLPIREAIARRGERWRPYRSVASWYLWRAAEAARKPAV